MSNEKKHVPDQPPKGSDINKAGGDISKGQRNSIDESVDWSNIEKGREEFTNNLPDYDPPPPPKSDTENNNSNK